MVCGERCRVEELGKLNMLEWWMGNLSIGRLERWVKEIRGDGGVMGWSCRGRRGG